MIESDFSTDDDQPPLTSSIATMSSSAILQNDDIICLLKSRFHLSNAEITGILEVMETYPMKISQHYFALIQNVNDPIWKQCIPSIEEIRDSSGEEDPLCEERDAPAPLITHRYPNRCLLLISETCDMYCRFCTRKRKVGTERLHITKEKIDKAIAYVRDHEEIVDVILSGGDALCAPITRLTYVLSQLRSLSHVKIIRLGTRLPCSNPAKITPDLVSALKPYQPLYINVHFEHPDEVTQESKEACNRLADAGFPLGNQNVLLKGVNDDPKVMGDLYMKLLECRVKPYYLFQADYVKGTNHFRTMVSKGQEIIYKCRGWLSGLAIPQYVIDAPSGGGKIPVLPNEYVQNITTEEAVLMNYAGKICKYPQSK